MATTATANGGSSSYRRLRVYLSRRRNNERTKAGRPTILASPSVETLTTEVSREGSVAEIGTDTPENFAETNSSTLFAREDEVENGEGAGDTPSDASILQGENVVIGSGVEGSDGNAGNVANSYSIANENNVSTSTNATTTNDVSEASNSANGGERVGDASGSSANESAENNAPDNNATAAAAGSPTRRRRFPFRLFSSARSGNSRSTPNASRRSLNAAVAAGIASSGRNAGDQADDEEAKMTKILERRAERRQSAIKDLADETFVVTAHHLEWRFHEDNTCAIDPDDDEVFEAAKCGDDYIEDKLALTYEKETIEEDVARMKTEECEEGSSSPTITNAVEEDEQSNLDVGSTPPPEPECFLNLPISASSTLLPSVCEGASCCQVSSECAICFERYDIGDVVMYSKQCRHAFHQECILDWFSRGKIRCPSCRTTFWRKNTNAPAKSSNDAATAEDAIVDGNRSRSNTEVSFDTTTTVETSSEGLSPAAEETVA